MNDRHYAPAALLHGSNHGSSAHVHVFADDDRPAEFRSTQLDWLHVTDPGWRLSLTELLNADLGRHILRVIDVPVVAVVKHAILIGLSTAGPDAVARLGLAAAAEPRAAKDGTVVISEALDETVAGILTQGQWDLIVAPDATPRALEVLACHRRSVASRFRVGLLPQAGDRFAQLRRSHGLRSGSAVVEDFDPIVFSAQLEQLAGIRPAGVRRDLALAWTTVAASRTNAAVAVTGGTVLACVSGRPDGPDAVGMAIDRLRPESVGSRSVCLAIDGNLPWERPSAALAAAGVGWLIMPGGSPADGELRRELASAGVTVVYAGSRAFAY